MVLQNILLPVTGFDSITSKPENGILIPYYIEYLSNWFDVNPADSNRLYTPMSGDNGETSWDNVSLTDADKETLANYIAWLTAYSYNGPTSANRDKLSLGFKEPGVQLNKANTYTYGTISTNRNAGSVQLLMILYRLHQNHGFKEPCNGLQEAPFGGGTAFRIGTPYIPSKVDFRMNGDDIEMKTFGSFKLIKVNRSYKYDSR